MDWIFEIRDKSGRNIHLSDERWTHIQKHPEMSGNIEQIKETLVKPTLIIPQDYDPNVRFYFRFYKDMKKFLFVSVKYLNGDGFIITSFYTDKAK